MRATSTVQANELTKVALLLPDGVGARNFLIGSFPAAARGRLSVSVVSRIPESFRRIYEEQLGQPIDWHALNLYPDTLALYMFRNLVSYGHMYSIDTFGMRCKRELPITGAAVPRLKAEFARMLGRVVARLAGMQGVARLDRYFAGMVARLPETQHYRQIFERTRPDVVLSSNQRPYGVAPAVLAAQSLGIPTATCIFSWDNLSRKGRIAASFDHYLVWSDLMRTELQQFYPEIRPEQIHLVGAMQFDPHADAGLLRPRAEFFRKIGADPSRPLLCYSAGDQAGCPEDQDHLELLLNLVRRGQIAGNPQVVLRPTPTGIGKRFDGVRQRHPELIYSQPEWACAEGGDWTQVLPLPGDPALLANLAHHCDVNISVASTITLDFSLHSRPVVNIAFDVANPPPFKYPLWDFCYRFEHYRPIVQQGAALFARSSEELARHVNTYLANPGLHEENRRRILDLQIGAPVGTASQRIVDLLIDLAKRQVSAANRVNQRLRSEFDSSIGTLQSTR